jgi:hypothetical protein
MQIERGVIGFATLNTTMITNLDFTNATTRSHQTGFAGTNVARRRGGLYPDWCRHAAAFAASNRPDQDAAGDNCVSEP